MDLGEAIQTVIQRSRCDHAEAIVVHSAHCVRCGAHLIRYSRFELRWEPSDLQAAARVLEEAVEAASKAADLQAAARVLKEAVEAASKAAVEAADPMSGRTGR